MLPIQQLSEKVKRSSVTNNLLNFPWLNNRTSPPSRTRKLMRAIRSINSREAELFNTKLNPTDYYQLRSNQVEDFIETFKLFSWTKCFHLSSRIRIWNSVGSVCSFQGISILKGFRFGTTNFRFVKYLRRKKIDFGRYAKNTSDKSLHRLSKTVANSVTYIVKPPQWVEKVWKRRVFRKISQ